MNCADTRIACVYRALIGLAVLFGVLSGFAPAPAARAQGERPQWSAPLNLSQSETGSQHPAIVADRYGNVHVFWAETVGGEPLTSNDTPVAGNTILYSRWDGAAWTTPTDVLYVANDGLADFISVDIDAQNVLHAVWTGISKIYYSNVPVDGIESAQRWATPTVITNDSARSGWESSVKADANGAIHVIYATRAPNVGVYHVSSQDMGVRWSPPRTISSPSDPLEQGYSNLRLVLDDRNRLHATWQSFEKSGFGQAIYYARSTDDGQTWSAAERLAYREPDGFYTGWAYLTSLGNDRLLIHYVDRTNKGRYQRTSNDGGVTWGEPIYVIETMEGINGYNIPVVDSAGQPHLIVNMRTKEGQIVGMYASEWSGATWYEPYPIDTAEVSAIAAHFADATVLSGNDIHVVWTQLRGGEIWHIHGKIASAPALATAMPGAATAASAIPAASPAETPETVASLPAAPVAAQPAFDPTQSQPMPDSMPVLAGALAAAMMILSVVIWRQARARRR